MRTSENSVTAKFAFWAFSEVDIPALCVAPSLCGRNSYVEITGSWPCLHKTLSGAGDGTERTSPIRSSPKFGAFWQSVVFCAIAHIHSLLTGIRSSRYVQRERRVRGPDRYLPPS